MTRPKRSDEQLRLAVSAELASDMRVDPSAIDVQTRDGVVTLRGVVNTWAALHAAQEAAHRVAGVLDVANDLTVSTVEWTRQRDDAARAVRNLGGVREVKNLIAIRPPHVEPAQLKVAIDQALERHAARSGNHVQIEILDGTVTLTGNVPSRGEHDAIVGAVTGTPGVQHVDNRLSVHGILRRHQL